MWTDNFYDLYFSKEFNLNKFRDSLDLKRENIPESLFKYKKINGNTLDLLSTDLIYLSNAYEFNDPYEGEIIYNLEEVYSLFLINAILRAFDSPNCNLSLNQKDEILNNDNIDEDYFKFIYENDQYINKNKSFEEFKEILDDIFKREYFNILDGFIEDIKKQSLIVCFSENNLINPMWAHYASNHEGICIEYNFKEYDNIFIKNSCFPMNYVSSFNQSDDLNNVGNNDFNKLRLLNMPFLNKSNDWKYEKEWRLLLTNDPALRGLIKKIKGNLFVKLPKPRAVYLGLNIDENYEKILDICKYREIPVFQMEKDKSAYNLYPNRILDFPKGNLSDTTYIKECITNKYFKSLIRHYFFINNVSIIDLENSFDLLISSFKDISEEDIVYFLEELLFKHDVFPVLYYYYSNVLYFLIKLLNNNYNDLKTSDGLDIEENIKQWISKIFFKFNDKKIIRYLILFEKLLSRFYNIFVILDEYARKELESKLSDFYEINVDYVRLVEHVNYNFNSKEELDSQLIYLHPFVDNDLKDLVNEDILKNLNIILEKFYQNNHLDEDKCFYELNKLEHFVKKSEMFYETQYEFIMNNSKSRIPILELYPKSNSDNLINLFCAILYKMDILYLLDEEHKKFIKFIAEIRYSDNIFENGVIANFASDCCNKLNIQYDNKSISLDNLNKFYNPKTDILEFINDFD